VGSVVAENGSRANRLLETLAQARSEKAPATREGGGERDRPQSCMNRVKAEFRQTAAKRPRVDWLQLEQEHLKSRGQ